MPKKYRQTVWLKKNDCIVIEHIPEGNKVKGEIICIVPASCVADLIKTKQWPLKNENDSTEKDELLRAKLLTFFSKVVRKEQKENDDDSDSMFPSSSTESDSEESQGADDEGNDLSSEDVDCSGDEKNATRIANRLDKSCSIENAKKTKTVIPKV